MPRPQTQSSYAPVFPHFPPFPTFRRYTGVRRAVNSSRRHAVFAGTPPISAELRSISGQLDTISPSADLTSSTLAYMSQEDQSNRPEPA